MKLYDVRRAENGGTRLYKSAGANSVEPYPGCPKGGAHYDLTLPIKDADGTAFTFVGLANESFRANNYIGSIKLPDTTEYINYAAFWQCYYLTDFVWPEDVTRLEIGDRLFDTCQRLVGPMEWPAKFTNLGDRSFTDCPSLVGFAGLSVTNVGNNAFQNCPALRTVELGDGASVTFGNQVFQNSWVQNPATPNKVLFHGAPPKVNEYILAFNSAGGGIGNTTLDWMASRSVIAYIPLNGAKDGPTDAWKTFVDDFAAAKDGNLVTFPAKGEDGAWGDGSIYNAQLRKTVKLRFWDPDYETSSALLAY